MADIKISQLTSAQQITGSEMIPLTSGAATVKATSALIKEYAIGDTDISNIGDGTPTGAIASLESSKADTSDLGTAAAKDSTNAVTQNSTDLVESGAVYTGLAAKANTSDLGTAAAKNSTNAVTQNSTDLIESGAVYAGLAGKANSADLATVATSGSYNDLLNKPTLGTAAAKASTNAVTQNSTDLVESGAVYSSVDALRQALTTTNNVLGAKNLLPNEGTSQVYRGITFTFLTDGSIVANGTADSNNNAELKFTDLSGREIAPRNKTYILTGCPSGGNGKYNINIAIHNRSSGVFTREIADVGNGAEFTLGNDEVIKAAFVKIEKGETVNNLVFAPMIRPVGTDSAYVPYAMTNRELTEVVTAKRSDSSVVTVTTTYGNIKLYPQKDHLVQVVAVLSSVPNAQTTLSGIIPSEYRPNLNQIVNCAASSDDSPRVGIFYSNGDLIFRKALGSATGADILGAYYID